MSDLSSIYAFLRSKNLIELKPEYEEDIEKKALINDWYNFINNLGSDKEKFISMFGAKSYFEE